MEVPHIAALITAKGTASYGLPGSDVRRWQSQLKLTIVRQPDGLSYSRFIGACGSIGTALVFICMKVPLNPSSEYQVRSPSMDAPIPRAFLRHSSPRKDNSRVEFYANLQAALGDTKRFHETGDSVLKGGPRPDNV
jgi:hypothetical protein